MQGFVRCGIAEKLSFNFELKIYLPYSYMLYLIINPFALKFCVSEELRSSTAVDDIFQVLYIGFHHQIVMVTFVILCIIPCKLSTSKCFPKLYFFISRIFYLCPKLYF